MGVGSDLYMYDVVVKRWRSPSHLLMSSCKFPRPNIIFRTAEARVVKFYTQASYTNFGWQTTLKGVVESRDIFLNFEA